MYSNIRDSPNPKFLPAVDPVDTVRHIHEQEFYLEAKMNKPRRLTLKMNEFNKCTVEQKNQGTGWGTVRSHHIKFQIQAELNNI